VGYFIAMIIGYVIGARSDGKDLDQLSESVKALRETEEFGDVVAAARSHVGHALREFASMVEGRTTRIVGTGTASGSASGSGDGQGDGEEDLVEQVRHIFGQP
jgi:hypothetical protein